MQKKDLSKIKWGEIYTCDLGSMKGSVQCGVRPVLVVQTNKLNSNSPTVVVAVITSARKREDISSHIFLETDCGLREPSMVMLEQMRTIDKAEELIDHMNEVLRHELLRMISWYVGTEKGFNFSLGKNYKFLDKHISKELWDNLLNTYSMSSYEEMWKSFDLCLCLFKKISKKVADSLGYNYPDYDENVTKYLETQKRISNKYLYGNRY